MCEFLLFFGFLVPMLRCHLLLPLDALLCGKILASDFVGNSGSPQDCHPFAGHTLGNNLVHIGPYDSCPCVFCRDHSHHVVGHCIYRRAHVGRGRLSGIALLPGPDYSVVLCAGLVLPAN